MRHRLTILAYEMNGAPVSILHGAPLRLRCENELGFKMVKWIAAIEFVRDFADLGAGQGGYNEDHEFYGYRHADLRCGRVERDTRQAYRRAHRQCIAFTMSNDRRKVSNAYASEHLQASHSSHADCLPHRSLGFSRHAEARAPPRDKEHDLASLKSQREHTPQTGIPQIDRPPSSSCYPAAQVARHMLTGGEWCPPFRLFPR